MFIFKQKSEPAFTIIFLFLITCYSLLVAPGYRIFTQDHQYYIPPILSTLHPEIYSRDFLHLFPQGSFSIFGSIISWLIIHTKLSLFFIFFLISFCIRYLYYYAIFKISYSISDHRLFSLATTILFLQVYPVFGTATLTMDYELLPRLISITLCLLAWSFDRQNYPSKFSPLLYSLALFFHVLTTIPFLILYYSDVALRIGTEKYKKARILYALVPIIATSFYAFSNLNSTTHITTILDTSWEQVLRMQTFYIFMSSWPWYFFIYAPMGLSFIFIYFFGSQHRTLKSSLRLPLSLALTIPPLLSLLSFILVDLQKLAFVAQLQLARSMVIWIILSILLFAYAVFLYFQNPQKTYIGCVLLSSVLISLIFARGTAFIFSAIAYTNWLVEWHRSSVQKKYNHLLLLTFFGFAFDILTIYLLTLHHTYFTANIVEYFEVILLGALCCFIYFRKNKTYTKTVLITSSIIILAFSIQQIQNFSIVPHTMKNDSFMEACDWIQKNTSINAVFITEPFTEDDNSSMRTICLRNVFVKKDDGSQGAYDREYALEWRKRMFMVQTAFQHPELLNELADKMGVDYVITSGLELPKYKLVFSNAKYYVYSLKKE